MAVSAELEAAARAMAVADCMPETAWPDYVKAARGVIAAYEKAKAMKQYDRHDL